MKMTGYTSIVLVILLVCLGLVLQGQLVPMASNVGKPSQGVSTETRAGADPMVMYFQNTTSARYIFDYSTTYMFNTTLGNRTQELWDQQKVRMNFCLHPNLAGDLQVTGPVTVVMFIATNGVSANANLDVEVWDVSFKDAGTETATKIYDGSGSGTITTTIESYQIDIPTSAHTFPSGHSMRVYLEIQGGASAEFGFYYGNESYDSRIIFEAEDTLDVSEVFTKDHQDQVQVNFDLDIPDKTVKMFANVTDVFGGYDIYDVRLTLLDPVNTVLINNLSMPKVSGTPISFANIYQTDWNYSGAPIGQYTVVVWAVDMSGYLYYYHMQKYTFGNYSDIGVGTFFVGGLPTNGLVWVKDSLNNPLAGARVEAQKGSRVMASNCSDAQGRAGLGVYKGIYNIVVTWQGVVVKVEANYNLLDGFNLSLICGVFYPGFKVVDHSGNPLEGANVYMLHPNGTFQIAPFITDEDGLFNITQAPLGSYELIVKWRDVEVAHVTHPVDSNALIATIICDVFLAELRAVDFEGIGLEGAHVLIADSVSRLILDSKITDLDGWIIAQLPVGNYNISVYWQERLVKTFDMALTDDCNNTLSCWVYYVNLKAVDSHDQTLENAQFVLTLPETGGVVGSGLAGASGMMEFRLPIGPMSANVYWKDVLVNQTTFTVSWNIGPESPIVFDCDVYYVYLHLVDSRAVALEDARVVMTTASDSLLDTQTTDDMGNVSIRSPKGDYAVAIYWKDVEVYNGTLVVLKSDRSLTLDCNVYYLQIIAQDTKALPLESATVIVTYNLSGAVFNSDYTDIYGQMTSRLPRGAYDLEVYWHGVLICSVLSYSLNQGVDQQLTLPCKVFYLTVKALDNGGEPVPDVLITVEGTTNGLIDSQRTSKAGSTEFRLPVGTYNVTGRLQESYFLREVDQTVSSQVVLDSSKEAKLTFSEYPPVIVATPGFWIMVGIVMAIIALIIIIMLLRRGKGAEKEADERKGSERPGGALTPPPPAPEDEEAPEPEGEKPPEDMEEPEIEKTPEPPEPEKEDEVPEAPKDEVPGPPASEPPSDVPPAEEKPPMDEPSVSVEGPRP